MPACPAPTAAAVVMAVTDWKTRETAPVPDRLRTEG